MPKPCPACDTKTEEWWSYCAMCGYHIAAGNDHDRKIAREELEAYRAIKAKFDATPDASK